jgi:hypothetical protein
VVIDWPAVVRATVDHDWIKVIGDAKPSAHERDRLTRQGTNKIRWSPYA